MMEKNYQVKSAVAIVVFNRPKFTQIVFDEIRKVKPKRLYIIQDGPRNGNSEDVKKTKQVQEIFKSIDWECEVKKNISNINLGCSKRPHSGFSWVFEQEESAIILEDDCVPSIDFFEFCDCVLEKYKDDKRVMMISGTNIMEEWKQGDYSYHFSTLGGIHGWASWRRAWNEFDVEISKWSEPIVKKMVKNHMSSRLYATRSKVYDSLMFNSHKSTAWDFQWGFARMINSGLSIVPYKNLITNIGYGEDSTHTKSKKSKEANLRLGNIDFPLIHPPYVLADKEYDRNFIKVLSRPRYREMISDTKNKIISWIKTKNRN